MCFIIIWGFEQKLEQNKLKPTENLYISNQYTIDHFISKGNSATNSFNRFDVLD